MGLSRIATIAAAAIALAPAAPAAAVAVDPAAVDAVKRYVAAIAKPDFDAAYALLTPAQQHYFRNARNFASNYTTTGFRVLAFAIGHAVAHSKNLAQVNVSETASYHDVAAARDATMQITETYFAIRTNGAWGVKEIYEPWKSYAPNAAGRSDGLIVFVDRIEFFDRRVQVDCTLRNMGSKPVQVLPLLQSKLTIGNVTVPALDSADFPLNDRQFFEGARIYPLHQVVGYLNFPWASHDDADLSANLLIGPAVEDGASAPVHVRIGPIRLPKL